MPEFVLPGEADRCPHCGAVLYDPPACCDRMTKEWVEAELDRLDLADDVEYVEFMGLQDDDFRTVYPDPPGGRPASGPGGGVPVVPGRNGVGPAGGRVPCPACNHDQCARDAAFAEGVAGPPGGGGEDWRRTVFGLALIAVILMAVIFGFLFLAAAVYGAGHRDGKLEAYKEAEVKGVGVWAPDPETHDMGFQFVGPPQRR